MSLCGEHLIGSGDMMVNKTEKVRALGELMLSQGIQFEIVEVLSLNPFESCLLCGECQRVQ